MKKLILSNLLVLTIAFAMFFSFHIGATQAQGKSFQGVYPFVSTAGYMGFFNSNDGMIYLYDSDLKQTVHQVQLSELGQPAQVIKTIFQEKTTSGELFKPDRVY